MMKPFLLLRLAICVGTVAALLQAGGPTTYDVGPGQPLATLAAVPWESLQPGDTVRVHAGTYHEKVLFSASGTAQAPIQVVGVPDAAGNMPVLDATAATTRKQSVFHYNPAPPTVGTGDRGLFVVTPLDGQPFGYIPSYIQISGLTFRGAYPGVAYADAASAPRSYSKNAAGLFVERGQHITISGCRFEGDANGLFVASSDSLTSAGQPAELSAAITVTGCTFSGNGVVGDDHEHNTYTEALGITYSGCTFLPLRAGANGSALKDRSAGTVIQNCLFTLSNPGRLLDLVDPEDAPNLISADPSFQTTTVSDCVLIDGPQGPGLPVHFGGDTGVTRIYRPALTWTRNLMQVKADQHTRWRTNVFDLATNTQTVTVSQSTFVASSATPGQPATLLELLDTCGTLNVGAGCAITAGWQASRDGVAFTGAVNGAGGFMVMPGWK